MVRSRINLRLVLACLLSAAVAGCQTTKANLNAGLGGAPTPIIIAENLPPSADSAMASRIGSSRYLYAYTAGGGDVVFGLGMGIAFGLVGTVATTAITKTRNTNMAKPLEPVFTRGDLAYSSVAVAKRLAIPQARAASVGEPLPVASVVLYPSVLVLEKHGVDVEVFAGIDGIQTDENGAKTVLGGRARKLPLLIKRAELEGGAMPDAARFLDTLHAEFAIAARDVLGGVEQPTPPTVAPASPEPVAQHGGPVGNGKGANTAVVQSPAAPVEAAAAPVRARPAYRCNHTRVCQPTG